MSIFIRPSLRIASGYPDALICTDIAELRGGSIQVPERGVMSKSFVRGKGAQCLHDVEEGCFDACERGIAMESI